MVIREINLLLRMVIFLMIKDLVRRRAMVVRREIVIRINNNNRRVIRIFH